MKSILVKNVVFNLSNFIYAERHDDVYVRIYLTNLPDSRKYAIIRCKNSEEAKNVIKYINSQIEKTP